MKYVEIIKPYYVTYNDKLVVESIGFTEPFCMTWTTLNYADFETAAERDAYIHNNLIVPDIIPMEE